MPTAGAMCSVWNAPATCERTQPRALGRVGGERGELLEGAGGDDLAGAVLVGGGEAVLVERGEDLVGVAAEDGGHAGGGGRGGGGHGPAALADEDHRLLGGDDARGGGGGELTDGVAGADADRPKASDGCGNSSSRATRPAATSSGCATAVSRIVSASASVP